MQHEEKTSGIDTDLSNVKKALEGIVEKEAVVEETAQNDKKKVDSAKAAEMRYRALENLGGWMRWRMKQHQDQNVEEVVVTRWHIFEKRTISCRKENGRNAATEAATGG